MNWISVKDKLPTKSGETIICVVNSKNEYELFKSSHALLHIDIYKTGWITHWMSIPKRPA